MSSQKKFTNDEIEFLKANFAEMSVPELAKALNRSIGGVKGRVRKLGLLKNKRFKWTDKNIEILKAMFPDNRSADVAQTLNTKLHIVRGKARKLGLQKSAEYEKQRMLNAAKFLQLSGKANRFQKGNTSWNKGKKIGMYGRTVETVFKKGNRPPNTANVGDTALIKGGYLKIKVAEPNKWQLLNHYIWEQHHGKPVPKGFVLWFRDQNPLNCAIENLELISLKELRNRNSIHQLPEDLKLAFYAVGLLRRTINRRIKNAQK
jgi:hypothetical protein